mgnify:CR=1 FL=1
MLKEFSIFMYQMLKLLVIGLPLAIMLFCTAHLYFELKRLIQWTKN